MLPGFIIIGAQKSASTYLQHCLADHPDIYLPGGETPFFESPDYENSDIKQLENIFNDRTEKCVGIKRPNYLGKPEVPARIQEHLPNAKLIAVLRNPIDRAVSAYFHYIKYGFIPPLDVETGLREIISDSSFTSNFKRSREIIEFGYYHKYFRKYDHFMNNNQIMIFLHKEIHENPLESIQRAYDFLGVSDAYIPASLASNPNKTLYNLTRLKFLTCRNKFMFKYDDDKTRVFTKNMTFIDRVFAGAISALDRTLMSKFLPNKHPKIGRDLQDKLYNLYASDIEALEDLIQRDLSTWKPCYEIV